MGTQKLFLESNVEGRQLRITYLYCKPRQTVSPLIKAGYGKDGRGENGEKKMNSSLNMVSWKYLQEFQTEISNSFKLRRVNLEMTDLEIIHMAEEKGVTALPRLSI